MAVLVAALMAFGQFSELVKQKLVIAHGVGLQGVSYSIDNKADYYAQDISISEQGYNFDLVTPTKIYRKVYLNAIGRHNLSNAIGALAVLDVGGLPLDKVLPSLRTFEGIQRRMEVLYIIF